MSSDLVSRQIEGRLPFLGTRSDQREALLSAIGAVIVTVLYILLARELDTPTTVLEGTSLAASLACVWLARTENIWTMPFGLLAVILLGWYLLRIELVGQGWLQYVYYVPIQIVGWWAWARGGTGRTELPISRLRASNWLALLPAVGLLWLACYVTFGVIYDTPAFLAWDTSIVAASVAAQTLMTWKKVENWWFWTLPVNVSSILLYVRTDSWAFVFLYIVFLANSTFAWHQWHLATKRRT